MFSLFRPARLDKTGDQIELVSVHIPKTAGTSFRNSLKREYGEKAVARVDINLVTEQVKLDQRVYDDRTLDSKIRVLHGHFSPKLIRKHFVIRDSTPFITWLRHPVDRVISNYYYLEKRLKEELQERQKGINILSKMQRSLMEYAQDELNQNRMTKFLDGIDISDMYFVGIQEYYSEDFRALSNRIGWKGGSELNHNVTGDSKRIISDKDRKKIASLNNHDMILYDLGLELRSKRY